MFRLKIQLKQAPTTALKFDEPQIFTPDNILVGSPSSPHPPVATVSPRALARKRGDALPHLATSSMAAAPRRGPYSGAASSPTLPLLRRGLLPDAAPAPARPLLRCGSVPGAASSPTRLRPQRSLLPGAAPSPTQPLSRSGLLPGGSSSRHGPAQAGLLPAR